MQNKACLCFGRLRTNDINIYLPVNAGAFSVSARLLKLCYYSIIVIVTPAKAGVILCSSTKNK